MRSLEKLLARSVITIIVSMMCLVSCYTGRMMETKETLARHDVMSHSVFLVQGTERIHGVPMYPSRYIGTCFLVNWRGKNVLMTAWHVVEDAPEDSYSIKGPNYSGLLVKFTRVGLMDMAVHELPVIPKGWTPLETCPTPTNGKCTCWGYPAPGQLIGSGGTVTGLTDRQMEERRPEGQYLEISGVVIPGMSGGPVVDEEGRVFAVNALGGYPTGFSVPRCFPVEIPR